MERIRPVIADLSPNVSNEGEKVIETATSKPIPTVIPIQNATPKRRCTTRQDADETDLEIPKPKRRYIKRNHRWEQLQEPVKISRSLVWAEQDINEKGPKIEEDINEPERATMSKPVDYVRFQEDFTNHFDQQQLQSLAKAPTPTLPTPPPTPLSFYQSPQPQQLAPPLQLEQEQYKISKQRKIYDYFKKQRIDADKTLSPLRERQPKKRNSDTLSPQQILIQDTTSAQQQQQQQNPIQPFELSPQKSQKPTERLPLSVTRSPPHPHIPNFPLLVPPGKIVHVTSAIADNKSKGSSEETHGHVHNVSNIAVQYFGDPKHINQNFSKNTGTPAVDSKSNTKTFTCRALDPVESNTSNQLARGEHLVEEDARITEGQSEKQLQQLVKVIRPDIVNLSSKVSHEGENVIEEATSKPMQPLIIVKNSTPKMCCTTRRQEAYEANLKIPKPKRRYTKRKHRCEQLKQAAKISKRLVWAEQDINDPEIKEEIDKPERELTPQPVVRVSSLDVVTNQLEQQELQNLAQVPTPKLSPLPLSLQSPPNEKQPKIINVDTISPQQPQQQIPNQTFLTLSPLQRQQPIERPQVISVARSPPQEDPQNSLELVIPEKIVTVTNTIVDSKSEGRAEELCGPAESNTPNKLIRGTEYLLKEEVRTTEGQSNKQLQQLVKVITPNIVSLSSGVSHEGENVIETATLEPKHPLIRIKTATPKRRDVIKRRKPFVEISKLKRRHNKRRHQCEQLPQPVKISKRLVSSKQDISRTDPKVAREIEIPERASMQQPNDRVSPEEIVTYQLGQQQLQHLAQESTPTPLPSLHQSPQPDQLAPQQQFEKEQNFRTQLYKIPKKRKFAIQNNSETLETIITFNNAIVDNKYEGRGIELSGKETHLPDLLDMAPCIPAHNSSNTEENSGKQLQQLTVENVSDEEKATMTTAISAPATIFGEKLPELRNELDDEVMRHCPTCKRSTKIHRVNSNEIPEQVFERNKSNIEFYISKVISPPIKYIPSPAQIDNDRFYDMYNFNPATKSFNRPTIKAFFEFVRSPSNNLKFFAIYSQDKHLHVCNHRNISVIRKSEYHRNVNTLKLLPSTKHFRIKGSKPHILIFSFESDIYIEFPDDEFFKRSDKKDNYFLRLKKSSKTSFNYIISDVETMKNVKVFGTYVCEQAYLGKLGADDSVPLKTIQKCGSAVLHWMKPEVKKITSYCPMEFACYRACGLPLHVYSKKVKSESFVSEHVRAN